MWKTVCGECGTELMHTREKETVESDWTIVVEPCPKCMEQPAISETEEAAQEERREDIRRVNRRTNENGIDT